MINVLYSFLSPLMNTVLFLLLSIWFSQYIFQKKRDYIFFALLLCLTAALSYYHSTLWINAAILCGALILIPHITNHRIGHPVLTSVLYTFILEIAQLLTLSSLWIASAFSADKAEIILASVPYLFYLLNLVSKAILILILAIMYKKIKTKKLILPTKINVLLVGMLLCSIASMQLLSDISSKTANGNTQIFVVCVFFLITNLMGLIVFFHANRYYTDYQEETIKSAYAKASSKYFKKTERQNDVLQKIWHDMGNYMRILKNMGEAKDKSHIAYLEEMKSRIGSITGTIKTGNLMADTILNDKRNEALQYQIQFDVKALLPPEIPMSDMDFSSLLFNTLDNAIEANQGNQPISAPKHISVDMNLEGNFLYYRIENSCVSRKMDSQKKLHPKPYIGDGFGMRIIQDIADKYDGELKVQTQPGIYCVTVILHFHE